MSKMRTTVLILALISGTAGAQDAKSVLDNAVKALGAANLKSIEYSGSGSNFAFGQSVNPNAPWPRFNVKSYTRVIDYETVASREEIVRNQGEHPPRGGGGQPLAGEQRQVFLVSGNHAWNMAGENPTPAPASASERLTQIWLTPHGFLKAALLNSNATVSQTTENKKVHLVSFLGHGKFEVNGIINAEGLVEKVETWLPNPVRGHTKIETFYSDYRDFTGVKFPTKILQKAGGHPTLDITVTEVRPNVTAGIIVPDSVRQATVPPLKVEVQKLADGVWYLTGGSHHSVAVEFNDHSVVVEAPLNEERSLAVIAEVKKIIPGKPIKYVVNTHHHFDHSGGLRTYAAEGATIITHQMNKPFYEESWVAGRWLSPDKLIASNKKASFLTFNDKHVLSDGVRTMELHHIRGNPHNDAIILAYLPKEKLLIEADVFTPGPPNAPPPAVANPFSVNLYENIERLKLNVEQIAPIHGRVVTLADLLKAIGRAPSK